MTEDKFGKLIRKEFEKTEPALPESYEKKLEDLLKNLSDDEEVRIERRFLPKVAVIIICVFLIGAPVTYAAVQEYIARLEAIPEKEIEAIDEKIQSANVDADTYSRELTEQERERMQELRKQYEKKGKFPEGKILQVDKVADVDKNKFCYCYENSTFYLPQEELTDEQLLQIIDLQYIRDFAVIKSQAPEEEEKVDGKKEKSAKQQAKETVIEFLKNAYQIDVKKNELKVTKEIDHYIVLCEEKEIEICVDDKTGELITVAFLKIPNKSGIQVKEQDYINNIVKVRNLAKYLINESRIVIDYNYLKNGTLAKGNVMYWFIDEEGNGYNFLYSVSKKQICVIEKFIDYSEYKRIERKNDKKYNEPKGIFRKEIEPDY